MPSFESKLSEVVIRHIPGCTELIAVERLSGGASQETYRLTLAIGDQEVLMAMRRSPGGEFVEPVAARPGLDVEAMLMRAAKAVDVPEPEVYYLLRREDDLGDGFIMQWLEGEALGARIVRSPDYKVVRLGLARECGRILARIHQIDLDRTALRDRLTTIPPEAFLDQMLERYYLLDTPQPMIDYTARWLRDHLPRATRLTLVHNDFRNGNFLIDKQGIVAILDWEVAHIGDPMRDLGWMCTNSWRFGGDPPVGGFGEYRDLFAGYEEVSGQVVDPEHVKFWEVFGSFWWAIGCLGMAEHYRTGPDQSVERPAIGRRSSECLVDCINLIIPGKVELVEDPGNIDEDMPRIDELVISVRDFLRQEVMNQLQGRDQFLARVAGNSLDIALRDMATGTEHRRWEHHRLKDYFKSQDSLTVLRNRLVQGLRNGAISITDERIKAHLRQTVVNQIAIDQPKYSGFLRAIDGS
ncbi:MAG: phosphotransferase [Pseudomonadales bacterium]|nr:phosphotransferase [Pseudomonadales bacterium]